MTLSYFTDNTRQHVTPNMNGGFSCSVPDPQGCLDDLLRIHEVRSLKDVAHLLAIYKEMNPPSGLLHFQVMMYPEAARALYQDCNPINREPSKKVVDVYAGEMKNYRWFFFTGEANVILSSKGNLLNGQQTLEACVKAGLPIGVTLVVGADEEVIPALDTGRVRSKAANITISNRRFNVIPNDGPRYYSEISSTLIMASIWRSGNIGSNGADVVYTHRQVLEDFQEFGTEIWDSVREVNQGPVWLKQAKDDMNRSVCYFTHWTLGKIDPEIRDMFFEQCFGRQADLVKGDPLIALARRLKSTRMNKKTKMARNYKLAYVIKGFNAWANGNSVQDLRLGESEISGKFGNFESNPDVLDALRTRSSAHYD